MQHRRLGRTDLKVSALCLGTMTWGSQNTAQEGHAQMDMALDHGINFFDTAEMYAVPASPDTSFRTETIIGEWFARTGQRDKVVLATKAAGPGEYVKHIRGGPRFSAKSLQDAAEGSLNRLQTDVIDIYQLHWPERTTNFFGQLGYKHREGEEGIAISETVAGLKALVDTGKIRHWGLSNETPWGTMTFIHEAEKIGLAPPVSIQNPYSLLNRSFEVGLAEIAHREQVGLLAYSPLAFGMLSGKYRNDQWPEGARLTLFKQFARYSNPQAIAATEAYCELASERGVSPAQLALQFVTTRPFVTSNIIGATTLAQLEENLKSIDVPWDKDLEKALNAIHTRFPYPAP
ncbi:MAG: aldo/keto reductase [Alcanivorax borkumensis]|jgi:aryl-alcohol dehydrogenase-like predicted oxidoreductase|uniref:aldo/keto reductase n=1 Tax=unclassified Alcanivorax TaxID=2638842 RepID=UPI0004ABE4D9|nr:MULTISPECIES: aldo/keto reductase [unclassified Alcanivorax]OJH07989.1 MAG: aldo/keto reductase [Alcanivorax borkumensis]BAP13443.1 aldo/keto reductase [Alcanivorax sp. NBRC 101098]